MKIKTCASSCLLLLSFIAQGQPRELQAIKTDKAIKIDGLTDEEAWKEAAAMTGFIEYRPKAGTPEDAETKTVAYLLYNDEGIFFGGFCYERTKDSITTELSGRDGFGANDYIGIIFDTYYDKQNGFEYFITPLGEQWDSKMTLNNEDFSWNAVWKSGAVIHPNGWSFEMFIPYSAIRFGKKELQNWGVNVVRRRRKTAQQYCWNPVDPNINGFLTQEGVWTGITNIKPPLRLQFSPYFSTYVNHFPEKDPSKKSWATSVNGGMDVKYGINQAFTLDATLIPDFGQVQSDNRILNLTPFEVQYTENRPFFTEGFELFSKGDLFYTRRIGKEAVQPYFAGQYLQENEVIKDNPLESKLINATKLSGRTQKGLGIGILNAITNNRYAVLEDTITGQRREVLVDPLTNYNIFVLDQTLKNNSSVSLVNTNVWRSGSAYDANVTAALFSLNDKKNVWNISGKVANSRLMGYDENGKTISGYHHRISFGKRSGRFGFNLRQDLIDTKFNTRDLGYFTYNNTLDHYAWMGYNWLKPASWYNNLYLNFNFSYSRQLKPSVYRNVNINFNINGQLKNLWYAGISSGYEPKGNDFFEPRVPGRVFKGWSSRFYTAWVETNIAKKYVVSGEAMYVKRSLFGSERYVFYLSNRYRFNDKLTIGHALSLAPQNDNVGFAGFNDVSEVIFGRRDIKTVENTFTIKYSFSSKMSINTRLRHYWSKVAYKEFFTLLTDGSLEKNTLFNRNVHQNYNVFNMDAVFTWQFAPGSFINIVWKSSAEDFNREIDSPYLKNFSNTVRSDATNNLSFKVIYFLDYLDLKKIKKKKENPLRQKEA